MPDQLAELKALEAKATLEPWHGVGYSTIRADHDRWVADTMYDSDTDLMIALRNHAKELIATAERVNELKNWCEGELNRISQSIKDE